jgi:hypothetical protein
MPLGPPVLPYAKFHVGETVKVIDANHARFEQTGTVAMVSPEGYTQSQPVTPFGEIDSVQFSGVPGTIMFSPSQLELVS